MILDRLLALVAPYECLQCAAEGSLLCQACRQTQLQPAPSRCYRCRKNTKLYSTCQTCRSSSELNQVIPATAYKGVARDIIWQLKFNGAQAAATEMAAMMQVPAGRSLLFVPVPTATSRVRRRGYDQAGLLARALARRYSAPQAHLLHRIGQTEQLGASRRQRQQQLSQAFVVPTSLAAERRQIVLIDDVLTTGASLEAAAKALQLAGAKHISAAVFAQA